MSLVPGGSRLSPARTDWMVDCIVLREAVDWALFSLAARSESWDAAYALFCVHRAWVVRLKTKGRRLQRWVAFDWGCLPNTCWITDWEALRRTWIWRWRFQRGNMSQRGHQSPLFFREGLIDSQRLNLVVYIPTCHSRTKLGLLYESWWEEQLV